jgi:hypothetical protein
MALIAADAEDRARQMLAMSERLAHLIADETRLMRQRQPLPVGPLAEEKARLANLYRQEMARIGQNPALIAGLPAPLKDKLKVATATMQRELRAHELELAAAKEVSEGIIQAVAQEANRVRSGPQTYGSGGAIAAPAGANRAVVLNRTA